MIIMATGHRPSSLGGYSEQVATKLFNFACWCIETWVIESWKNDVTHIISGMALGWDQAVAKAAIHLGIPFTAAVPCNNQDRMWPKESKAKYSDLLSKAKEQIIVSPGLYEAWKMQARNEWMVDHAELVLALYSGAGGGTKNCIDYAASKDVTIHNMWDHWTKWEK